uniref:Solute-binding protein family 5 domain-containing protein n=1 Tax=candidate division WOR-3 bacterium TaxID=2052148 RepID=A0A7C4TDI4_UNCW3
MSFRIFIILFLLFSFCTSDKKDTVVILYDRPPRTLDPHLRSEVVTLSILCNVYECLVDYDPNLRLIPKLADNWSMPDSLTWEISIRKGVKFHNHKLLTAQDVAYSFYRIFSLPGSEMKDLKMIVDTVIVVNEALMRIKTKFPYHYLLTHLTNMAIVPKDFTDFAKNPTGTGPYRVIHITKDSIVFIKNAEYYGRMPEVNKGIFKFVPEISNRIELIKNNKAQIVYGIPSDSVISNSIQILFAPSVITRYLEYDLNKFPFNQFLFRQAINLSINRREIAEKLYNNFALPANQFIPKGFIGYIPEFPVIPYEPESAQKLIKKIGLNSKIKFAYAKVVEPVGKYVAENFRSIGIDVEELSLAAEEFWAGVENGKFDCYLISSINTSLDGFNSVIISSFHTNSPERGMGLMNSYHYSNPKVDMLIDKAIRTRDREIRLFCIKEIQRQLLIDLPTIPIIWEPRVYGVSREIKWHPRLDQQIRLAEIEIR